MTSRRRSLSSRQALVAVAAVGLGWLLRLRRAARLRFDFQGRTVLITGGTRGLGFVLARQFLREGAKVALCGRDAATLERAREALTRAGGEVLAVTCDVRDQVQVEAMVSRVHERFGAVDVLVNNAGIIQVGPLESLSLEDFREALDTHLWASLYTTLAVLNDMKRRGRGRIVNIASIGGKVAVPHLASYCASKFAQVGLSEALRAELAQDGIAVTTVCPGLMRTGSPRNAAFKGDHSREYAWFAVGDALAGLSLRAERAARLIVEACRRGDAEVRLGLPAKVAVLASALSPQATARVLEAVNHLLPQGSSPDRFKGSQSETRLTRSWLTRLSRRAAQRNNEAGASPH
ncbi:ketoacyl reductase [Corallococcus sp. H22C18031201]|uniref:SDR family NAD(P)-dependent oxidoreductase n=1 Tax=Citreicoccus inhibens TaxID=2849499 RepID=UPI000E71A0B8|nr:SDR family oxidoreductase [Citreicoccus inhibens]MBU8894366.1 SDR family oxidoreductase [Citreicoccus inhibens]RJS16167.1 ketoacyl reductase [Corallococcus sp. H22C18031201]